jgi:tetratricopeptide (TPR) repeat protein
VEEIGLSQVCDSIDDAFRREDYTRVAQLLWPALDQFSELPQLWFYAGNYHFQTGKVALAERCFKHCVDLDSNPLVLANLGASLRRLNKHEEGLAVLEGCLDRYPDYEPALVNLGSMFVNEGDPDKGIPPLERAVKLGTEKGKLERGALWNLGLLYLEAGKFAEGFDIYRKGLGAERMTRSYGYTDVPEPEVLGPEHDGTGKTLIVYGEQGIGDELMAGTIIEDARKEFGEVIFECHPRLVELHQRAHPGLRLFPTRKDDYIGWPIENGIRADYKCPILDLAARYRRNAESFESAWNERGATYSADTVESSDYREQLEAIAQGRPIVGLATHGGVIQTARQYRTMRVNDIENLFANTDCLFVGLDYDDMTGFTLHVHEKFGEHRYRWFPAIVQHFDYQHTAAIVEACDMVVTVCQSVAHLSAGMGKSTRVLTPKRCAWRYAPVGDPDTWFFYPGSQIKLYRQDDPNSWDGPIARVVQDIKELT